MQYGRKYCTTIQREGATFTADIVVEGEATKISFQTFVDDFSLTICLWMIS